MIASTCAAFSNTRTARAGAWSGTRWARVESRTCSTSRRGSPMSPPDAPARNAPSASAAERTASRRAYSASPRSKYSTMTGPGSEYTVHDRPLGSGSKTSGSNMSVPRSVSGKPSGYSKSGTRPTSASGGPTRTASPAAMASRPNWVPGGRPRTSPGTGSASEIAGCVPVARAAVRMVCSSDTAPGSSRSGHDKPVRSAAAESYAVTECLGVHRDNASRTSSGAAAPASHELAHTESETLGHHMMAAV